MAIKTTDSCAVITDRLTRRFGSFIAVNNVFVAIVDRFLAKNDFAAKTHRRDAEGAENPENEP